MLVNLSILYALLSFAMLGFEIAFVVTIKSKLKTTRGYPLTIDRIAVALPEFDACGSTNFAEPQWIFAIW